MTFKELVYAECRKLLNNKIDLLQQTLADLKESASNETKSTAGDKHETALAMLQIEQEHTGRQLKNLLSQKLVLQKIILTGNTSHICNGCFIRTNNGYFFLSIALGKITVEGTTVTALSPQSPLGSKLMGLKVNETAVINRTTYEITSIE